MKFIILKNKLKDGINTIERISGKSLTLPILNNILISVEKNFLNLTSTDLEVGINWWALVKTEEEGKIAIPNKILSSFINYLPEKPVTVETDNLSLKIECENYQTIIKGTNPDDFPIIPQINKNESIFLKSALFCQSLSQVVDIAGYFSTKPEISGIYFLFQKDMLTMAATDSFRLGEKKIFLKPPIENLSKNYSFILPQKAAREIINIFGEKEGDITFYFSPNQVLFEASLPEQPSHPEVQLISRLIEGEYPSYQEIIPKKYETKVILPKNDLINQIKAASLFGGKINEVKIKIDPKKNQVDFSSQNPELGEHQSFLTGKIEGAACEISFNHKFLLDGLLNISPSQEKNSEVILELVNSEKPGVIKPQGDDSYLYLIMPIKT
ncbi:MAG: DNA polymerase III subunit beta [bacterium]|nr:DNA polymerase III subunit beta [bacterium]